VKEDGEVAGSILLSTHLKAKREVLQPRMLKRNMPQHFNWEIGIQLTFYYVPFLIPGRGEAAIQLQSPKNILFISPPPFTQSAE
jgi:hypothetical protein